MRVPSRLVVGLATAVVVVAVAVMPFLSPAWVAFEQGRAGAAAWTGFAPSDLRGVTDAILADLVLGPPDFDVALDGVPVLTATERSHMRDVRGVFAGFYGVAAAGMLVLAWAAAGTRGSPTARASVWRSVRRAALGLAGATVLLGVVATIAFDAAFDVFHRVFFASGSYTFDPRTDRLVQLFPEAFWSETAIVVGVAILVLAIALAQFAGARIRRGESASATERSTIAPGGAP